MCSTTKRHLDLKDNAAVFSIAGVPTVETVELANRTRSRLHGFDRFVARKKIVERLEAAGLLDKIEPTTHVVPHGDRSGAVLEPFLTDQWYVDAKTLAQPAIAAVRERKTVFVPPQWEATFFNWMENIQPWCISRQIWWGHQIPRGTGRKEVAHREWASIFDDPEIFVAESEADAVALARRKYGCEIRVMIRHRLMILIGSSRDIADEVAGKPRWEPILRATKTCSTLGSPRRCGRSRRLGWPDETPELKRFYPTSTLVTGFDIIFFWVARMMMMGLHFMKEVPFRDVYIHALGARRLRRQDVEVEGQRRRSARRDRPIRRRRVALHARAAAPHKATTSGLVRRRRKQPQFRNQALERRALCRDERCVHGIQTLTLRRRKNDQSLDHFATWRHAGQNRTGAQRLSLQ